MGLLHVLLEQVGHVVADQVADVWEVVFISCEKNTFSFKKKDKEQKKELDTPLGTVLAIPPPGPDQPFFPNLPHSGPFSFSELTLASSQVAIKFYFLWVLLTSLSVHNVFLPPQKWNKNVFQKHTEEAKIKS